MAYYKTIYQSPVGPLTLISDESSLLELRTSMQPSVHDAFTVQPDCTVPLQMTVCWLNDYFSGRMPSVEALPLAPQGTAFQKRVWHSLLKIPYGQTITYQHIAQEIAEERGAHKMSAQAVGQAVGKNPISIIIPCHRVVGSNGSLTGYAGGLQLKRQLLAFENAI